ncbi:MAG: hypothetical protein KJO54_08930, partial [Gammaproteobacteria bacterium]|nr:hypothetical protein [Gammaproteobacteria bacterium]
TYTATATLEVNNTGGNPGEEQVEFYVYRDPGNSEGGEPSGGVNWQSEPPDGSLGGDNGGDIMFVSSLTTLRVRPNDCTAPASYLSGGAWEDISVPTHVVSLDPIGFVDPITGRMFSDQLAVKSSLLGFSDNNGDAWTLSQGSPFNPGVDHQTLGGGRLAEPLYSTLNGNNPLYNDFAHAVYYASQDVAVAQAGISLDGGQTFGAAVPMWTLAECSGLHGHVKVAPNDGTAYVPNKSCGGEQGMAVSTDNGATWDIVTAPDSGTGEWDPSIGVGANGTVYFGMDSGGSPLVDVYNPVSGTWMGVQNVAPEVKTTAFSTMVAGDDDRAAFSFLGTTTPGALGTSNQPNTEWSLYVSMTFDGGVNWTTTNVTEDQGEPPVQRGVICDQGTTCASNRNLLDFNDLQMDKRGRPVAMYAIGCTGACETSTSITQNARAAIARLKSPKGLFSAYDGTLPRRPDWPLTTAVDTGADVEISWQEPGDGGSPILDYQIRKNGAVLATVGPAFTSYTDVGAGGTDTYEILARNAEGLSVLKPSCNNGVIPGVDDNTTTSPCDRDGLTILTDKAGDIIVAGNPLAPNAAALDVRRLGIAQNEEIWGVGNVAFVLDVQSTDTLPPNAAWPIQFNGSGGGDPSAPDRWVRMDTQAGAPRFSYGTGSIDPVTNPGALADSRSMVGNNQIIVVVPASHLDAAVGQFAQHFMIRVRENLVALTITPDNMPDSLSGEGTYTRVNFPTFCAMNNLPDLLPDVADTIACHPVTINVLANDSDIEDGAGENLDLTGVSAALMGTAVIINDGGVEKVHYIPNPGFVGVENLTYTAVDSDGGSSTGDITITVTGTPDDDNDGVMNSCDNCLLLENPDQCNTNAEQDKFGNLCDTDLDNNNITNTFDLAILRENFGQTGENDADFDCNGIVNTFDLTIMREQFGLAPGPSGLPDEL